MFRRSNDLYPANPHDLALVGLSRRGKLRRRLEALGRANAVNSVLVAKNLSSDTNRGPSPGVWGDCPWNEIVEDPSKGVTFFDDFMSFPKTPPTTEGNWGQYAVFTSTGGAMTAGTGQGGEVVVSSDDDNEGVGIRTLATPFKIIRTARDFWFECRLKMSTVADTKFELFIGLMEDTALTATVPITATAATLADKNLCGFYRTESDGDAIDTTYKADGVTAVTVGTAATVPAANTYLKLGMKFKLDSDLGLYYLTFYRDNERLTNTKQIPSAAGTDFPNDVGMGLVFAVRNAAGSSPGTATLDWWKAAQLL